MNKAIINHRRNCGNLIKRNNNGSCSNKAWGQRGGGRSRKTLFCLKLPWTPRNNSILIRLADKDLCSELEWQPSLHNLQWAKNPQSFELEFWRSFIDFELFLLIRILTLATFDADSCCCRIGNKSEEELEDEGRVTWKSVSLKIDASGALARHHPFQD